MRDIEGYEGLYAACEDGRIWAHGKKGRWKKGRFLKTWLIGHGYEAVMLYRSNEKPQKYLVHRLIALTFIPNPEKLPEVNHLDAERRNNRPENLEWCTSKGNKTHAWKAGLYDRVGKNPSKGESHYKAKLTEENVKMIRALYKKGGYTQAKLAKMFDVTEGNIKFIIDGKTWKHIIA